MRSYLVADGLGAAGERACPPEDVGGVVRGYAEYLESLKNTDHERREELIECLGCDFDPEAFDPEIATKAMQEGLPVEPIDPEWL